MNHWSFGKQTLLDVLLSIGGRPIYKPWLSIVFRMMNKTLGDVLQTLSASGDYPPRWLWHSHTGLLSMSLKCHFTHCKHYPHFIHSKRYTRWIYLTLSQALTVSCLFPKFSQSFPMNASFSLCSLLPGCCCNRRLSFRTPLGLLWLSINQINKNTHFTLMQLGREFYESLSVSTIELVCLLERPWCIFERL